MRAPRFATLRGRTAGMLLARNQNRELDLRLGHSWLRRRHRWPAAAGLAVLLVASCQFDTAGVYSFDGGANPGIDGAVSTDAHGQGDAPQGATDAHEGTPDAPPEGTPDAPPEGTPDAPEAAPDAAPGPDAACPGECSSCEPDGTCVINCGAGECMSGVTCPSDLPCVVNCEGAQACENGFIDCMDAASCAIHCIGQDACDNGVECGGSICVIVCDGSAACEDGLVSCDAESCDITCTGPDACAAGVCCDGDTCSSCTASGGGSCHCPGG